MQIAISSECLSDPLLEDCSRSVGTAFKQTGDIIRVCYIALFPFAYFFPFQWSFRTILHNLEQTWMRSRFTFGKL